MNQHWGDRPPLALQSSVQSGNTEFRDTPSENWMVGRIDYWLLCQNGLGMLILGLFSTVSWTNFAQLACTESE
jgi:hypothetical protein